MATISTTARPAYVYDAGGDQWVPIAWTVLGSGAASAPALTFTGDSNTGLWSPGADTVAFSTGGVERLRIGSTGNVGIGTSSPTVGLELGGTVGGASQIRLKPASNTVDFRLVPNFGNADLPSLSVVSNHPLSFHTNNTERMRIDSSGNVGIGTTAPSVRLHVRNSDSASPEVRLQAIAATNFIGLRRSNGSTGSETAVASGDVIAEILALGYDGANFRTAASIRFDVDAATGASDMPGRIVFFTTADGASSPTERMRIDSSGAVGIGMAPVTSGAGSVPSLSITTAANDGFAAFRGGADVNGQQILFHKTRNATPTSHTAVQADDQMGMLNFYGSDGSGWVRSAVIRGVVDGTVSSGDVPGRVVIFTKPVGGSITERMRIDNAGLITGTGTSLGAWTAYTPTLGGTGWAIGNGTATGKYVQIGKTVHYYGRIVMGSTSTFGAGNPNVSLPLSPHGDVVDGQHRVVLYDDSLTTRYFSTGVVSGSTVVCVTSGTNGAQTATTSTAPFTWTTSDVIAITGTYQIA